MQSLSSLFSSITGSNADSKEDGPQEPAATADSDKAGDVVVANKSVEPNEESDSAEKGEQREQSLVIGKEQKDEKVDLDEKQTSDDDDNDEKVQTTVAPKIDDDDDNDKIEEAEKVQPTVAPKIDDSDGRDDLMRMRDLMQADTKVTSDTFLAKNKSATSFLYRTRGPSLSAQMVEARKAGVRCKDGVDFSRFGCSTTQVPIPLPAEQELTDNLIAKQRERQLQTQMRFEQAQKRREQLRKQQQIKQEWQKTLRTKITPEERRAELELREAQNLTSMSAEQREQYNSLFQHKFVPSTESGAPVKTKQD